MFKRKAIEASPEQMAKFKEVMSLNKIRNPSKLMNKWIKQYNNDYAILSKNRHKLECCTALNKRGNYLTYDKIKNVLLKGRRAGYISIASCKNPIKNKGITHQLEVFINKIFIDLDSDDGNPNTVLGDVEKIRNKYGCEVIESGGKGYHCIIYCRPITTTPTIAKLMLNHIIEEIKNELDLKYVDGAVQKNNIALRRMPGTYHEKTGKQCRIIMEPSYSKMTYFKEHIFKETFKMFKNHIPKTYDKDFNEYKAMKHDKDRPTVEQLCNIDNPKHFSNPMRDDKNPSCFIGYDPYYYIDRGEECQVYYVGKEDGKWKILRKK